MPKEIFAIVDGVNARLRREHEAWHMQNHALAVLISYAFHDPGKMPDPPGAAQATETSSAADDARVRGYFMALAMRNDK